VVPARGEEALWRRSLSDSIRCDFVCAFEREEDAEWFYQVLGKRLKKFGLELSGEKARLIAFDRRQPKPGSFEFLGFEFRCGKDRQGKAPVEWRISRKKLRSSLDRFTEWCREKRHCRAKDWFKELKPKLQGYYNYYGVSGNYASLQQFFGEAM
jgi:RNA-directed DNA polymerase